jgi:protein-S-isoprenylcysteine O-methyltransferase Ste14
MNPDRNISRLVVRWLIREILGVVTAALILFFSAGRWDWGWGWSLVVLYAFWVTANAVLLIPRNPDLLAERAQRDIKGMKPWDKNLLSVVGLLTLGKYIIAGLDIRYGWSADIAFWSHVTAWLLGAAGYGLSTWSMVENAYFSMVVRYQEDRNHEVCETGPYRYIRHPAYVGTIVFEVMAPLILGSWWSLIPGVIIVVLMVLRTSLEDKTLREELPGYKEYMEKTRFRLLPRIW